MKKRQLNNLLTGFFIIFVLFILYKLYNKLKEAFQTSETPDCGTFCETGGICTSSNPSNGVKVCLKLAYTTGNKCDVPALSAYKTFLYNPSTIVVKKQTNKNICLGIKASNNTSDYITMANYKEVTDASGKALCNGNNGEIPLEMLDNSGNKMPTFKKDPSGNIIRASDRTIVCVRLQPTLTGKCLITPTAEKGGFFATFLNSSSSEVKDLLKPKDGGRGRDICITFRNSSPPF